MLTEIAPRLFIGTEEDIANLSPMDVALVSLAQTFHYKMHGWKRGENHKNDPCYVMCHHGQQILSINWVDGDKKLFDYQGKGVENVQKILAWIEYQLDHNRDVIIMCNKAISRSPSIALTYLAKTLKILSNASFAKAKDDFLVKYPNYRPGGIGDFLADNWNNI